MVTLFLFHTVDKHSKNAKRSH